MSMPADGPQQARFPVPRLTPDRVRSQQFSRTPLGRRGVSEEEVRAFLGRVAEDIAARDASEASLRATVDHYKTTIAHWQSEDGIHAERMAPRPSVDAVNILSRAQQEADTYVAQTQEYCRRLALDARQHAEEILDDARGRAEEAARQAAAEHRRLAGDELPEQEDLVRRLAWARTFVTSLETVEAQLRTAREALQLEFERMPAPPAVSRRG
ncbi:MAG TPA: DivIVA domain-containing protein [Acidimicrobiales bacterium]|nr:DivIVA domain-containing protein [Acidimicrobiales bacterium]